MLTIYRGYLISETSCQKIISPNSQMREVGSEQRAQGRVQRVGWEHGSENRSLDFSYIGSQLLQGANFFKSNYFFMFPSYHKEKRYKLNSKRFFLISHWPWLVILVKNKYLTVSIRIFKINKCTDSGTKESTIHSLCSQIKKYLWILFVVNRRI